eukprot:395548-Pelagomonas_calceolata.AAC.4
MNESIPYAHMFAVLNCLGASTSSNLCQGAAQAAAASDARKGIDEIKKCFAQAHMLAALDFLGAPAFSLLWRGAAQATSTSVARTRKKSTLCSCTHACSTPLPGCPSLPTPMQRRCAGSRGCCMEATGARTTTCTAS